MERVYTSFRHHFCYNLQSRKSFWKCINHPEILVINAKLHWLSYLKILIHAIKWKFKLSFFDIYIVKSYINNSYIIGVYMNSRLKMIMSNNADTPMYSCSLKSKIPHHHNKKNRINLLWLININFWFYIFLHMIAHLNVNYFLLSSSKTNEM